MKLKAVILLSLLTIVFGCREDDIVVPAEYEIIDGVNYSPSSKIQGFYLLNEGNMGSNKCTLDYFDYPTSTYIRNLYADRNPNVVKELGDVGNDIGIYGEKLYVVVNCSHKVEILNARTGIRLGQVNISNCRYVTFHKGKAYVSSYVGPVSIDPKSPLGEI
ncbi:MAG: YncE family protein, partial [Muribaculaceae bacterium]|nr:YncE family protein [Muribaculaceae bacterium]